MPFPGDLVLGARSVAVTYNRWVLAGVAPRKNIDVMREAIGLATKADKKKKKKNKSRPPLHLFLSPPSRGIAHPHFIENCPRHHFSCQSPTAGGYPLLPTAINTQIDTHR